MYYYGVESDKLVAASKHEDDVNFYQTIVPDTVRLFHINPKAKHPALVLLKKKEVIFGHVEMDNEDVGKPIVDFFGITGNTPKGFLSSFSSDNFATPPPEVVRKIEAEYPTLLSKQQLPAYLEKIYDSI
ncbi:hypothetical protein RJT34_20423 [Clitoria ternatea]|uniref:Uncharacterized protein n=1 Tax=Clitoria ternatea TaxID=43366 RepID=A0AAN9IT44_CLITE